MKPPAAETTRDRVLTDDELALVWQAAERLGGPYGDFVRMLTLTAQRREEVGGMRRSEIRDDVWSIAAERMKGGVAHDVPLGESALELLKAIPSVSGDFVFTFTGDTPLRHYGGAKQKLDATILPSPNRKNVAPARALDLPRPEADGGFGSRPAWVPGKRYRGGAGPSRRPGQRRHRGLQPAHLLAGEATGPRGLGAPRRAGSRQELRQTTFTLSGENSDARGLTDALRTGELAQQIRRVDVRVGSLSVPLRHPGG